MVLTTKADRRLGEGGEVGTEARREAVEHAADAGAVRFAEDRHFKIFAVGGGHGSGQWLVVSG